MRRRSPLRARLLLALAIALAPVVALSPARAGPPYLTDDPQPTDTGHWEIYNFASGTAEPGAIAADFGPDLNYGAARDLQLTVTLPLLHAETGARAGMGTVQIAGKYRVAHQNGPLGLDVAFFPRVFLPTARGCHTAQVLLPLWAQRDSGPWSTFFGGGWTLNRGAGQRDFWQAGAALTRTLRPGWSLGGELFWQGRDGDDARPLTTLALGTQVHIHGPFSWLASLGQGINRHHTEFYTALKLDL